MRIVLMRHGEAEPPTLDDASRELTPMGCSNVAHIARAFAERSDPPSFMAFSPLERARQTAEIVRQELTIGSCEVWDELKPSTDVQGLAMKLDGHNDIMLVTHQPLAGDFVEWLTGKSLLIATSTLVVMNTSAVANGWGEVSCIVSA